MSKPNYTPGPWRTGPKHIVSSVYKKGDHRITQFVAEALESNGGPSVRGDHLANARLMAAAPDLYEACELALSAFENNTAIDWNILSKALAKARGEE